MFFNNVKKLNIVILFSIGISGTGFSQVETPAGVVPGANDSIAQKANNQNIGVVEMDENTTPSTEGMDSNEETWESYIQSNDVQDVADEVTGGIRVEDIVQPPSEYRYAAFGKGDPFSPPLLQEQKVAKLEIPIVSVLQNYSVDELPVVGLWELTNGKRKALIMTPKGEGVVVKVGDVVGKRSGKVISIDKDAVNVREFILAPDGTRQFEDVRLGFGKKEGGVSTTKIILDDEKEDVETGLADSVRETLSANFRQNLITNNRPDPVKEKPSEVKSATSSTKEKSSELKSTVYGENK